MEIILALESISLKVKIDTSNFIFWTKNFPLMLMFLNFNVVSMELFILLKWKQMEVHPNGQLTKLELNMELATVMLNVLMIWNLSGGKLIVRTGMMILENMALVVLSSILGKQTNGRMLTQLIPAQFQEIIDVKVKNVEMELRDKMEYVIKMAVI